MTTPPVFGVDIGGSGIKGAPVDVELGALTQPRHKVLTPHPARPEAVAAAVREVVQHFEHEGPVGLTFPGVVVDGHTRTAANVDQSWLGLDAEKLFQEVLDGPAVVLNDADAAGLAEMAHGAAAVRAARCWCSPSAPASAAPSSWTVPWCPTPSWATWSCAARTRSGGPRPRPRTATSSAGPSGRSGWTSTWTWWSGSSHRG